MPKATEGVSKSDKAINQGQPPVSEKKKKAELLASGYTAGKRFMEICSIVSWALLLGWVSYRIFLEVNLISDAWLILVASIAAMFAADFFSGIVHWACDTWGTVDTPVFSPFIRSFREHHVDPYAMTKHDFIETNGDNCLLTVPFLLILSYIKIDFSHYGQVFLFVFMACACFWVSVTNQIHKWSHTNQPSAIVRFLQDSNIILSRRVHNIHHQNPFDRYYCITTGWLNPIFHKMDLWGTMEATIERFTDNKAREDDAFWTGQTPLKGQ